MPGVGPPTWFDDLVHRANAVTVLRLAGFLLVVSAEVYLVVQLGDRFTPVNHYSYFTVLANVYAAVVLLLGVFRPLPDLVRGAAVLYLATTGIVYWTLLFGVDVGTPAYANVVLHAVMPVLVVVEWLLAPPASRIRLPSTLWWIAFPVIYLAYSLVRGPFVGWYPYPFLDPGEGGYAAVATTCVVVAVAVVLLATVVASVGNALNRRLLPERGE